MSVVNGLRIDLDCIGSLAREALAWESQMIDCLLVAVMAYGSSTDGWHCYW